MKLVRARRLLIGPTLLVVAGLAASCTDADRLEELPEQHPSRSTAAEARVVSPPAIVSSETPAAVPSPAAHSEHEHGPAASPPASAVKVYTCVMHPEIKASAPGECPKCGMTLVEAAGAGVGR